jgi:predicted dehydrogenase
MAMSLQEAREMLEVARQSKIQLVINSQPPWWPENYAAYNLAKSGELGKVWRVHTVSGHGGPAPRDPITANRLAFWSFLNDEKRGGGAMLDFGPYGAAWVRWFLGMPKTVYAIRTHTRTDVYKSNTNVTILASYPDNRVGIIEASWDLPRNFERLEVFGNLGSVQVFGSSGGVERMETYIGRDRRDGPVPPLAEDHRDPATYFGRIARDGKPAEDFVSGAFHVDVMEILEAARRSADSGQPVSLPLR